VKRWKGGRPELHIDAPCGLRHRLPGREQSPGQDALEPPSFVGEPELHRRGGPVGRSFRPRLDEVLPDRHQSGSADDRLESPPEGDRFPLVIGARVAQQLVQLVVREHCEVSSHRFGRPRRPLGTSHGIRKGLQDDARPDRLVAQSDPVVGSPVGAEYELFGLRKMRYRCSSGSREPSSRLLVFGRGGVRFPGAGRDRCRRRTTKSHQQGSRPRGRGLGGR